jgi:acyl-CoA reductase-like NAD-dependent aldehyde dehydrogenase
VGTALVAHPDVDAVSFTGSTTVGRGIVAAASGTLKRVSLELGGKNPQIVFPDADLDAALDAVVFGVYFNMGECCNSGSRVLLHRDVPDAFVDRIVAAAETVRVGDPLDEDVQYGPIISPEQHARIKRSIEQGRRDARLATGGGEIDLGRGRYLQPTVFTGVTPGMPIASEEVFGPVLSILRFEDADDAARIANGTMYGLSASIWSESFTTQMQLARRVKAGTIWMNTFLEGASELPFGGYAQSGLGRELGRFAAEEYTELKTLYMRLSTRPNSWL